MKELTPEEEVEMAGYIQGMAEAILELHTDLEWLWERLPRIMGEA